MNPRTWLARWVPEPDGRAARLPLCLFGMMVTAVKTFGFVVFESLPLVAELPFSSRWCGADVHGKSRGHAVCANGALMEPAREQ